MTDRELKRMSRIQLVELILEVTRKLDDTVAALEEEKRKVERLKKRLADRKIMIESAGSIAESSLQLGGVFTAAQKAASVYLENIERIEGETAERCRTMEAASEEKCRIMEDASEKKCRTMEDASVIKCRTMEAEAEEKSKALEDEAEARIILAAQKAAEVYAESMKQLKSQIEGKNNGNP